MELWKAGEIKAVEYLDKKGYRIISRNYRCRFGEIDIIAECGGVLCFIEVKTRTSLRYGMPCEAVGERKLLRMKRTAEVYMSRHRHGCDEARFEVIEIIYRDGRFYARHINDVCL